MQGIHRQSDNSFMNIKFATLFVGCNFIYCECIENDLSKFLHSKIWKHMSLSPDLIYLQCVKLLREQKKRNDNVIKCVNSNG